MNATYVMPSAYAGFDLLTTMVLIVRADGQILHANSAFEDIYGLSKRFISKLKLADLLQDVSLPQILQSVVQGETATHRFEDELNRSTKQLAPLPVQVIVANTSQHSAHMAGELIVEMIPIERQTKQEREARLYEQSQANKELIRNLAHEIKNPLGGIRGAAQLLQMEMHSKELIEYTQVIIHEADRLQTLVDRLLEPHRKAQVMGSVNIHEVCERVCALILAEFPRGLEIIRDYDTSIPELTADKAQLIQAILNITHNAAQALACKIAKHTANIKIRTRVSRQVTYGKIRHKLALELHIIDNGPGIPEDMQERIFYPLVSGKEGGSGLGLTLAQTFIQNHQGFIACSSWPGHTDFTVYIPLPA